MKDKKIYIILIISILLTLVGVSLAYFSLKVVGNENAKINKVVTGNLELTYTDTSEISLNNAIPGNTIEKVIKVRNTGTKEVSYNIGWTDYINEITNNELVIEGTCKNLNSSNTEEGTCNGFTTKTITGSNILSNISIEPNITHEYTLKITFKETNKPQNYNKNKSFSGKINITESNAKTVYCTFNGELTQGAEYVNGQYTYRYMQDGKNVSTGLAWKDITTDGWGVQLTDKSSTDHVTSKVCTYINNKPIISMSFMFDGSRATTIDLSSFDTSKVTSMRAMFSRTYATTLDLSNFNTSNVTDMGSMFSDSKATTIDLSSFDTSKVTIMSNMFGQSQVTTLDLRNFDTSSVTKMNNMFYISEATTIDVSGFDTSNVTRMDYMFGDSQATTLDVSGFDTSNVTDMSCMFCSSPATTIDLSSFNTSNVTSMRAMFSNSKATTLDLSSFDTSKVTNMSSMFYNIKATTLDLSNFNTSNVTSMKAMFSNSKATTLDLSSFNTSNVTDMSGMFYSTTDLKTIYASSKFNTDTVTSSTEMFYQCTSLVGGSGTKYSSSHIDKTYARIDGGTSSPGYFTAK